MNNFTYFNPTKVHFGRESINKLGDLAQKTGSKALLMYGGGSIKNNGIYDKIIHQLAENSIEVVEYAGIKSNPVYQDVNSARDLAIKTNTDMIIAVGGGSVIDSAKIAALVVPEKMDAWDIMTGKTKPTKALPIITVLTLAATGSEMNQFAVLQNHEEKAKKGFGHPACYPKHSILDPELTYSVPKDYTAYGIVDLIAHALEAYFGDGECGIADRIVESIIKESIAFAPKVLNEPNNYDYRANIMWLATSALNGITTYGKTTGDWGVHDIGHVLSLLYDIPHGASLSIAYPAWLKLMKNKHEDKINRLGEEVFDCFQADDTISGFEGFFKAIGSPIRLSEINIGKEKHTEILKQMKLNKVSGYVNKLEEKNYPVLIDFMA
ncbi:MAG: NADH-dependent alcohol dehydrogenase [Marinilabiliales bacterium]|nr:MAG: NADH-dependent alcohol dehydrogenase [Marinilabiliales bacterium]